MKKIIISVVCILIVFAGLTPFVNGLVMKTVVENARQNLNTIYSDTGYDVSIEINTYDRGYSTSQIEWKIDLGAFSTIYGIEEIILVERVSHGFTGVKSQTSLEKNTWFTNIINTKFSGINPLHITTEYTLLGNITSTIGLDPFSFEVEEDVLEVKAGEVVISSDKELKKFVIEADWQGLAVQDKVKVEGVGISSVLEMISSFIWHGNISSEVKKISFNSPKEDGELVGLKSEYVLNYEQDINRLSLGMELGVDTIVAGQNTIDNALIKFAVNKIDAQGYEELMKIYTSTISSVMTEINSSEEDPEALKAAMEAKMAMVGLKMITACEKILKKGLELQISELQMKVPEGDISGNLKITLEEDMTFTQFIPMMNQPALAFDVLSLQSEASIPTLLVGENPMLISPLMEGMQTGLFIQEDDKLVHEARTREGKLYINGEQVLFN